MKQTGGMDLRSSQMGQKYTTFSEHGFQLNTLLISSLVVSSMFIAHGGGAAPVDIVLIIVAGHALLSAAQGVRPVPEMTSAINGLLFAVSTYIAVASLSIVVHGGDVGQLAIDAVSFTYILIPLIVLGSVTSRPEAPIFGYVLTVAALVFALATVTQQATRASGFMANPNMAAVWLGLALILFLTGDIPLKKAIRVPTLFVLLAALIATDSYSALLGIGVSATYLIGVHRKRVAAAFFAATAIAIAGYYWKSIMASLPEPERLASSEGSRSLIWSAALSTWKANPFGIGHGNFVKLQIFGSGIQTHNDYLSALVEDGLLGLLAVFLIGIAVWKAGHRVARAMLIFFAFTAFFHNELNFRHIWIFLAIGIAIDVHSARRAKESTNRGSVRADTKERGAG